MLLKFRNIVHLQCIRFVGNEINEAIIWFGSVRYIFGNSLQVICMIGPMIFSLSNKEGEKLPVFFQENIFIKGHKSGERKV